MAVKRNNLIPRHALPKGIRLKNNTFKCITMLAEKWSSEQIELRNKRTRSPGFFVEPKKSANLVDGYNYPEQITRPISAQIYPNGEFGIGYCRPAKMSASDRRYEADRRYADANAEIVADIEISPDGQSFTYGRKIIPGVPAPKLDLGSESSQARRKYGLKGITSYGRKIIRNAGHCLDVAVRNRFGSTLQMGTLTIPSLSPQSMRCIAVNWHHIVRRFFQECKRESSKHWYRFDYVSCTEIQPKRLDTRNEVGLHLHFLYVAIRCGKNKWVLSDSWVRKVWRRVLQRYVDSERLPDNLQYKRIPVSVSGAAYVAKYASKGDKSIKQVVDEFGEEYLPSQWWSCSQGLKNCIKEHTISSTKQLAEKLLVIARWGVSEYVRYIRVATMSTNRNEYGKANNCPEEIVLGYGGLLSSCGFRLFSPGNQNQSIKLSMFCTLDKPSPLVRK
jgi:hypothetical protein